HLPELRALGAFADNQPEVHAFDVLAADNGRRIDAILGGSPVDILIDDALHTSGAILRAFRDFRPRLADAFLYFVEDNAEVHEALAAEVDGVLSLNELTVVRL